MIPPLDANEINTIVNKKYNNRHNLTPLVNASRRFFYNPDFKLNSKRKRSLTMTRINKDKTDKSKMKISDIMINWDYNKLGKITIRGIVSLSKMNKKTVQKYYSNLLKELNIPKNKLKIN
jgi:hypothetical protein